MTHTNEWPPQGMTASEAKEAFFDRELTGLVERNSELSERHGADLEAIVERNHERQVIILTCMDERDFGVEEAYGLLPGEAEVYASGGGKLDAAGFERMYGAMLDAAERAGKDIEIYMTPHECSDGRHLGCAAFGNDTGAQKDFFGQLKAELAAKRPNAKIHVLAFDTSTDHLRRVDADASDAALEPMLEANEKKPGRYEDTGHQGYGIYIGDAYRAWVPDRNRYFRLSAMNPDISGNADIALTVMDHHSGVDLSDKTITVHVDYPSYEDAERTEAAKANIDAQVQAFLASPAAKEKSDKGDLKIVKTRTDMKNWKGELVA